MQIGSLLIALIFVLSHELVLAETTEIPPASDTTRGVSAPDAENTGVNVRDKRDVTLTPEKQGGQAADREITAAIRRAIVKNDSLSHNAHNVKIITRHSTVTLRGPVESTAERTTIGQIAEKTAGVKRVDNQLEVNVD